MKIVDNIIVEATEAELMEYYLKHELDNLISFKEYREIMIEAGTVLKKEDELVINGFSYSREQFDRCSREFGYCGF
jgi:hypothetical protein